MRSTSRAVSIDPSFETPRPQPARSEHYGGIVGDMIAQIEERIATPQAVAQAVPAPVFDPVHMLSVASGYVALGLGLAATGWLVSLLF